jgi:hypothetical protein
LLKRETAAAAAKEKRGGLDYSLDPQTRQRSQIGSRDETGFRFPAAAPMGFVTVSQSTEREGTGKEGRAGKGTDEDEQ